MARREMRISLLVDLAAQAEREILPKASELMMELVAVHPLPVHGVRVGHRQLKVIGSDARARVSDQVEQ